MQIFADSANVGEIAKWLKMGVIDGVTTNPSLMAKMGRTDYRNVAQEVCYLVQGSVSAEVISTDAEGMVEETLRIAQWSPHVAVKVPFIEEGLKALKRLKGVHADPKTICDGCPWLGHCDTPLEKARASVVARPIQFNVTLVFSANQALLAAKAGAAYVSPFVGRLDDIGHDGMQLVEEIVGVFNYYDLPTQVIAASIRHPQHCLAAAQAGAHIATVPYKVLMQMIKHPLTDIGIARFLADWKRVSPE